MAQKIKKFSRPKRLTSPRAAHIWATLHAAPPFSPSLPSSHHPPSPRPPPNLPLRVTGVPAIPPAPSPLIPMPQLPRYVPSVSRPHWAPALARCPPDPLAPSPQPLVYRPAHGTSTAPQSSICLQKPRCPLSCPPQGLPPLESVGPASIQRIHTSWPCPIMSPHIPTEGHSTQKPLTMQIDENSFSDKEICMENRSNFPRATKSVRENLCTCGTSRFLGPQVPLLWWHHQATTRRPSILRPTETSARPGVGEKAAWRTSVTVITQPETRSLQRVQSLRITFQCIDTLKIACPSVCRA
jgi:hypothetical protein